LKTVAEERSRSLPFPGRFLLRIFLEDEDYEQAAGDFQEEYDWHRRHRGPGAARRRFWVQMAKSLPHFAADDFYWRTFMIRTYAKTAWRDFCRHKTFSTINLTGLALGMACCLLITFWVRDERGYDRFHAGGARIFRVVSDWPKYTWNGYEGTPPPLGPDAREQFPEVERSARVFADGRKLFRYGEKTFFENRGIVVDPDFFDVFSFPLAQGDVRTALAGPADIVVSEAMAARYFGNKDPLGQTLLMEAKPVVVRGVVKSLPRRSTLRFDYALACEPLRDSPRWSAFTAATYLLLKPGADVGALESKLTERGRKNGSGQVLQGASFRLQPLWTIHLDGRSYQSPVMELGDGKSVALFSVIAALVLVVACVNFVNLATARSGLRAKEIGLRKTIGAGRRDIIRQFFGESALNVGLAALLALVLARLLLPAFNQWSGKNLGGDWLRIENLGILAAILGATLLLAGGYPALVLSSFEPARVLKDGDLSPAKGGRLRKALVLFQFSVSIALLVTTGAAVRQFRFMRTAGLGYDKDSIFQIPIEGTAGKSYASLKARWLENTTVKAVTLESYSFAETGIHSSGNWDWEGRDPNRMIDMVYRGVDQDYFGAMGIPVIEGRPFGRDHPSDALGGGFILNEEAVRAMGIRDPVGKWFQASSKWKSPIVGVVGDVRFQTMHSRVEPNVFYVEDPADLTDRGIILVRTDGPRTREALDHVRRVWAGANPSSPIEIVSLQETYDRLYRGDQRMSRAFSIFAGLAVLISFLGLLGLASFMAERRRREIGIRKVLGASRAGIVMMISGELAKWVLAANLVAWPVSYFTMNKLLQAYAYRIGFSPAGFLIPSAAAFVIAFVTVGVLALRASSADPARVLKHE
jgi:putative ABC transport system permease protein